MAARTRQITRLAVRVSGGVALLLAIGALGSSTPARDDARPAQTQTKPVPAKDAAPKQATPAKEAVPKQAAPKQAAPAAAAAKLGLLVNSPKALQGYTLLAPMASTKTHLIDMQGKVVQTWDSDCYPALCPMLLENGHLLRPGSIGNDSRFFGPGPGVGGRIQEFTWEGKLVWDFRFYNARQLPHHDITRLPNGNVLLVVSDRKTAEQCIAAGRRPELTGDSHLIPDSIVEIKQTGLTSGEVVWEWHVWDHLVQDFDKTKANFGNVVAHPELVNVNYGEDELKPPPAAKTAPDKSKADKKTDSKAAAQPAPNRTRRIDPDWTHFNSVAYNADLEQVVVSVPAFNEIWILDHSTTPHEAAGHVGGRYGKGGDLLYRFGNPRASRAGTKADQKLFFQHNAHWIAKGCPGEGHLLLFNNGPGRTDGGYSSVDELALPVDSQGHYAIKQPAKLVWSYTAAKKSDFFSRYISGTQRLANGNTLICSGANGTIFEVTPEKEIVWKYVNPVKFDMSSGESPRLGEVMSAIARDMLGLSIDQRDQLDKLQNDVSAHLDGLLTGDQKKQATEKHNGPSFPRPGQVMASAEQDRLKLTDDQKKDVVALQKVVDDRFDKVLNAAQRKQLKSVFTPNFTPPAAPPPVLPGRILTAAQQDQLKLSGEQKKQLQEIQKELDVRLATLFTEEQKRQFQTMQRPPTQARPPGPNVLAGGSPLFRAYRYPANYPGLAGIKLTAGKSLEELQPKEPGRGLP